MFKSIVQQVLKGQLETCASIVNLLLPTQPKQCLDVFQKQYALYWRVGLHKDNYETFCNKCFKMTKVCNYVTVHWTGRDIDLMILSVRWTFNLKQLLHAIFLNFSVALKRCRVQSVFKLVAFLTVEHGAKQQFGSNMVAEAKDFFVGFCSFSKVLCGTGLRWYPPLVEKFRSTTYAESHVKSIT